MASYPAARAFAAAGSTAAALSTLTIVLKTPTSSSSAVSAAESSFSSLSLGGSRPDSRSGPAFAHHGGGDATAKKEQREILTLRQANESLERRIAKMQRREMELLQQLQHRKR